MVDLDAKDIKSALRIIWTDKFSVYEFEEVTNEDKSTTHEFVMTSINDEPCKLSYSRILQLDETDTVVKKRQVVKLFCDEKLAIKPGSKISVTRGNEILEFAQSGLPGVFSSHQEFFLVPWDSYA